MAAGERAQAPKLGPPGAKRAVEHAPRALAPKQAVTAPTWELVHVAGHGDRELARIAAAQKGFVVREQLVAAGLGRSAIAHRLMHGRLHQHYRGVYLVGHTAVVPFAEEMAALLCFRGYAVLSHRSAAAVWGIAPAPEREVTLTVVAKDARSRPGLRLFRVAQLDGRDLRWRAGLPLTAPARTVLDFASQATASELERALAEARVRRLVRDDELRAALARAPRRSGVGVVLRLLDLEAGPGFTRSEAERKLLGLVRAAKLPEPECNRRLCGYEVDFLWRRERLVVEVDGHAFHVHRGAFERDRRRDQVLVAAGYRVIRVTWRQLAQEPFALIASIAQALALEQAG